ncbi:60Kd inner membrane protein-domain-containing protein [Tuber brumale]|nr:60Kd inner membrane protein-domain-containing protein [Tuber brumale]
MLHLHPLLARPFYHVLTNPLHRRQFSSTPPNHLIPTILSTTHDLLTTLHTSTHLPYHSLIPLSAIFLRLTITTPLTIYSRRRALRTQRLQPILSAYQHPIARNAKSTTTTPQAWELKTRKEMREKRRELWKRWGCQAWKMLLAPVVQIPVWVAASMTLRGMTGIEGLPTWLRRLGEIGGEAWVEEALATEGALWFGDLLTADPYLALPMGFSFLLFANIELQTKLHPPSTRKQRVFTNVLRILSLAAFPLTANAPAALTLYWSTSAMFSLVQNIILAKVMPRGEELKPCESQDPYSVGDKVRE